MKQYLSISFIFICFYSFGQTNEKLQQDSNRISAYDFQNLMLHSKQIALEKKNVFENKYSYQTNNSSFDKSMNTIGTTLNILFPNNSTSNYFINENKKINTIQMKVK